MPNFPDTRLSLIGRVADPADAEAWREFVGAYAPAVYRLARKGGLQHADAEDVVQSVMTSVGRAVAEWKPDPARGRFRSWLTTIARNAAANAIGRRRPDAAGGAGMMNLLATRPAADGPSAELIELEFRRGLFRAAAERVRAEFRDGTWEAFRLTTLGGMSAEAAAAELGTTPGAVYTARSRVIRRLREEVGRLEAELSAGE